MKNSHTLKLTQKELDESFPNELLAGLEPKDFAVIQLFKLKAMTDGITSEDITQVSNVIKIYMGEIDTIIKKLRNDEAE